MFRLQTYFCKAVPCRKRKTFELHHVYNLEELVIIITINNNCNTATTNKKRQHDRFQMIVSTSGWPVNVLQGSSKVDTLTTTIFVAARTKPQVKHI